VFTACGIMHPLLYVAGRWRGGVDGRNHRSKHVELIGVINKPLLLHLVGCLYYLYQ
jgi:hypothetical protein